MDRGLHFRALVSRSRLLCFLFVLIHASLALGRVQVAFFEMRTKDGQLHPIEPGGHLYHVAIQYGDRWLNAHPYYGVQEVHDLREIGQVYSLIEVEREIPFARYEAEKGKKFSIFEGWASRSTTYCSKLVAQILGIPPLPLTHRSGEGLSPDDLYQILKREPHRERLSCAKLFH